MKNQTKTFTKKTELIFTTIEVKKTGVLNKRYTAYFESGNSKDNLSKQEIDGYSATNCIENVSKFLGCQIDEKHYTLK